VEPPVNDDDEKPTDVNNNGHNNKYDDNGHPPTNNRPTVHDEQYWMDRWNYAENSAGQYNEDGNPLNNED
jgi:hypothetical protein